MLVPVYNKKLNKNLFFKRHLLISFILPIDNRKMYILFTTVAKRYLIIIKVNFTHTTNTFFFTFLFFLKKNSILYKIMFLNAGLESKSNVKAFAE